MKRTEMKKLNTLILKYLIDRKQSDGGYAPVEQTEVEQLHEVIHMLLQLKYECDMDGNLPIQWELIDRTRFYHPFLHFCQVVYPHRLETLDEYVNSLRDAEKNLAVAQTELTKITTYIFTLIQQNESLKSLKINPKQ